MAKKLNITGIRGIPAEHGGFETFAEALSLYLIEKQWSVTVYCQKQGLGMPTCSKWQNVRLISVPIPGSGAVSTILFDLWTTLHVCFFSRSLTLVLGYNTAIFSILYRLCGIRSVMNMDGIEWQRDKWGKIAKLWFRLNEKLGCVFSNHLIADHEEIKNHLQNRHGALPITTIPYGAELIGPQTQPPPDNLYIRCDEYYLVIARPEPENSILEIVQGFVNSESNKKLLLLGNYSNEHSYQSAVLKAADDRVLFPGAIYDQNIVRALRYYCTAYIHGHTVGGTNPSLVEALGASSAIIAHDNRFNRGVCQNAALYFDQSNKLTEIINSLDKPTIAKLQKTAKARFESHYTQEKILSSYEQLLTSQGK